MGKCWAEDTHKLKVKIDGEEIQAEYIEFEHDLSSFKKSFTALKSRVSIISCK